MVARLGCRGVVGDVVRGCPGHREGDREAAGWPRPSGMPAAAVTETPPAWCAPTRRQGAGVERVAEDRVGADDLDGGVDGVAPVAGRVLDPEVELRRAAADPGERHSPRLPCRQAHLDRGCPCRRRGRSCRSRTRRGPRT